MPSIISNSSFSVFPSYEKYTNSVYEFHRRNFKLGTEQINTELPVTLREFRQYSNVPGHVISLASTDTKANFLLQALKLYMKKRSPPEHSV